MRRRSNLQVLVGTAFFVVGGLVVYLLTNDEADSGSSDPATVSVVVGTVDIPVGALGDDLIEAGQLTTVEIPAAEMVSGAVQTVNQLEGAVFIQGFAKDQQITATGLQLRSRSFVVPEGHEAVAVQIDFVAGGAGYVNAGDRINLYGLYTSALSGRPAPRAELLLTNVEVLDVDLSIAPRRGTSPTDPSQPSAQRASGSTVTYLLALRTVDAEKVIFTTEFASFYATLTGDGAPPAGPTPGRDGGNVLEEEPNDAANR
ncbi:MAG: Flp pilus assembly protein CpaB [Actinomycetota bacterium]